MVDDAVYAQARKQVRAMKGFYIHALVYVLVNAVLVAINLASARDESRTVWWSLWPLFGWGIGLAAHGIAVFGLGGLFGPDWEERKTQEIVRRHRAP